MRRGWVIQGQISATAFFSLECIPELTKASLKTSLGRKPFGNALVMLVSDRRVSRPSKKDC